MTFKTDIKLAFQAALPVMLGYVVIGIPCGILEHSIGMNALQVFLLSFLFYSGAGQFMIPNMYLAASSMPSIIASVSLVNTRQMLYSASLSSWCRGSGKLVSFLFAASVTDETFGVNLKKFVDGTWNVNRALYVNIFSCSSWALANVVGVLLGSAVEVPLAIASFSMTSIFICLLVSQKISKENVIAALAAMIGVFVCKVVGASGAAILIGASFGVAVAIVFGKKAS